VADTPELVEMILLQLPLPDIILTQRVNRAWQQIITGSPNLQRTLFFRPATQKGLVSVEAANLMLECACEDDCELEVSGPGDKPSNVRRWVFDLSDNEDWRQPIMNPFATQLFSSYSGHVFVFAQSKKDVENGRKCPRGLPLPECVSRPEAS